MAIIALIYGLTLGGFYLFGGETAFNDLLNLSWRATIGLTAFISVVFGLIGINELSKLVKFAKWLFIPVLVVSGAWLVFAGVMSLWGSKELLNEVTATMITVLIGYCTFVSITAVVRNIVGAKNLNFKAIGTIAVSVFISLTLMFSVNAWNGYVEAVDGEINLFGFNNVFDSQFLNTTGEVVGNFSLVTEESFKSSFLSYYVQKLTGGELYVEGVEFATQATVDSLVGLLNWNNEQTLTNTNNINSNTDTLATLVVEVDTAQEELVTAQAERAEARTQLEVAQENIVTNSNNVTTAQAEIVANSAYISSLQADLLATEANLATAEATLVTLATSLAQAQTDGTASAEQIATLQADVDAQAVVVLDLQTAITNLNTLIAETQDDIIDLQAQLATAQTALAEAQTQLAQAQTRLANAESAITAIQTTLTTLQTQVTDLANALTATEADLQGQIDTINTQLTEALGQSVDLSNYRTEEEIQALIDSSLSGLSGSGVTIEDINQALFNYSNTDGSFTDGGTYVYDYIANVWETTFFGDYWSNNNIVHIEKLQDLLVTLNSNFNNLRIGLNDIETRLAELETAVGGA